MGPPPPMNCFELTPEPRALAIKLVKFILCCYLVNDNYIDRQLKINKYGHEVKFNWCGYLVKFKKRGQLVKFILSCYSVKMNYLGRQMKMNKFGHQGKFKQCGHPRKS